MGNVFFCRDNVIVQLYRASLKLVWTSVCGMQYPFPMPERNKWDRKCQKRWHRSIAWIKLYLMFAAREEVQPKTVYFWLWSAAHCLSGGFRYHRNSLFTRHWNGRSLKQAAARYVRRYCFRKGLVSDVPWHAHVFHVWHHGFRTRWREIGVCRAEHLAVTEPPAVISRNYGLDQIQSETSRGFL